MFALPTRQAASAGAAWVDADWDVFLFGLVRVLTNHQDRFQDLSKTFPIPTTPETVSVSPLLEFEGRHARSIA